MKKTGTLSIREAIEEAKKCGEWYEIRKPVSVNVAFLNKDNVEDGTQLDLYEDDKVLELEELWESLCGEMDAEPDSILSVESLGKLV